MDELFWINFLGGFFWKDFNGRNLFGRNSLFTFLKSAKLFEYVRNWFVYQHFGFCQDFVSMEKEGREDDKFESLEVRRKLITLKKQKKNLPSNKSTSKRSMSLMVSRVQRSSPCSALSIASAKFDLSKLCVMASEPLHRVDKRLMVVLTVAVDLLTFKNK